MIRFLTSLMDSAATPSYKTIEYIDLMLQTRINSECQGSCNIRNRNRSGGNRTLRNRSTQRKSMKELAKDNTRRLGLLPVCKQKGVRVWSRGWELNPPQSSIVVGCLLRVAASSFSAARRLNRSAFGGEARQKLVQPRHCVRWPPAISTIPLLPCIRLPGNSRL